MAFCSNCGRKLEQGVKFCSECGGPIAKKEEYEQRKTIYDGELHKCPNCGEILKSFEIICSTCGYELRGNKVSNAVKEFALKLEAIEAKREYEKPRGIFAATEAQQRLSKTDEQKISLIKSFSVPNSKEDMLEFMILATSSMNMRTYDSSNTNISKSEKEINAAWFSKVQQVYEKAKRSYSTDSTFAEIKALYDSCNEEIKKSKKKGELIMADYSDELKAKLNKARSAEEVTELLKADGQDVAQAERLWKEIEDLHAQEDKELSLDELDAVAGGGFFDKLKDLWDKINP